MVIISYNAQSDIRVTKLSLNVKRVCAVLSFIALIAFVVMSILLYCCLLLLPAVL